MAKPKINETEEIFLQVICDGIFKFECEIVVKGGLRIILNFWLLLLGIIGDLRKVF